MGLLGGSAVSKNARAKMVNEQIAANRERVARFLRLGTQNVGVEQPQIAPLVELALTVDLAQHVAFHQKAEAAESLGFEPLAFVRLAKLARELMNRIDIDHGFNARFGPARLARPEAVRNRFDELRRSGVIDIGPTRPTAGDIVTRPMS